MLQSIDLSVYLLCAATGANRVFTEHHKNLPAVRQVFRLHIFEATHEIPTLSCNSPGSLHTSPQGSGLANQRYIFSTIYVSKVWGSFLGTLMQGVGSTRIFLTKRVHREAQTDNAGIGIVPIHVSQPDNSVTRIVPYHAHSAALKRRWRSSVPPLGALCIARLAGSSLEDPSEWLPSLPNLHYAKSFDGEADSGVLKFEGDLLDALADVKERSTSISSTYSPDIWLKLAMFFTKCLPSSFRMKSLPLSDVHVPIVQLIDPSPRFAVITVLSLRNRHSVLDDSSIGQLKDLHQLVSLDLSFTSVSSVGIHTLSRTLRQHSSESGSSQLAGPWKLRLLTLEGCPLVDNRVCGHLAKWPLLCFVDLRGTNCRGARIPGWQRLNTDKLGLVSNLVYPNHPLCGLQVLHERFPGLFPGQHNFPYALYIDQLDHPVFRLPARENSTNRTPFLHCRAGMAQDSDLAIFPANLKRKAIVCRAPVQEEDQGSITQMSAKDPGSEASGSGQFYAARHRQHWRRAMHEDEDDIFGGVSSYLSDDDIAPQNGHFSDTASPINQSESLVIPNLSATPTPAHRNRMADSKHMQHTLAIFFSRLPSQSSRSRVPHGSLEDTTSPATTLDRREHQTLASVQIPEDALRLIAVREPPPFLETLSSIQAHSLDEAKRREEEKQTMQILAGEVPAQLRKRKSVDDGCKEACLSLGDVRSRQLQLPSKLNGDNGGFWKEVQAKRQRQTENAPPTSPFPRHPQVQGTKGTGTPTSTPASDVKGGDMESGPRPTRQTPFGFAAKKAKK